MTIPTDQRPSAAPGAPAPVPIILALSFLASIGTGIVTNGVYFITAHSYHFSKLQNYGLGLLQGITYVVAAIVAGRAIRLLRSRAGMSTRRILVLVLTAMGALCFLPYAAQLLGSAGDAQWPIWLMVALYIPLTGVLWPIVEGYLSGGRSGDKLRRALGTWNLWWSSAVVAGMWLIGPLLGSDQKPGLLTPQQGIAALGLLHIVTVLIIAKLESEPGRHIHEQHPHPPVYERLLETFRILLPTSYLVSMALSPYLPTALEKLGISNQWTAPIAATWLLSRVFSFFILDRWHGWHGRWMPAVASIIFLVGGFAGVVLSPIALTGTIAIAGTLAGLAIFGMGMAMTYTAALYYAMEVGQSEVDAGGTHESLIGLGYTIGPLCGLIAASLGNSTDRPGAFENRMLLIVGILAIGAFIVAALKTHSHARASGQPPAPNR